jgi:hypothetical protein
MANAMAIGAGKPIIVLTAAREPPGGGRRPARRPRARGRHILADHVLYRTALEILMR